MSGRRRRGGAAAVVLTAWLGPGIAAAESVDDARADHASAAPRLEVTGCPSSWNNDVQRSIAVEIGVLDGDAGIGTTSGVMPERASQNALSIRCGAGDVVVEARGPATGERLERTLSRDDLPAATGPRIVALAAVELLAALDPALRRRLAAQAGEPPLGTARPAPSIVSGGARARAADRRFSLVASGVYRAFEGPAGLRAWGGALDGRRASAGGAWSIRLGVEVAGGERSASLGRTSALLASARASVGARGRPVGDGLALSFELGARGGVVRLAGRSGDSEVVSSTAVRPWAGPVAILAAQLGVAWFCTELAVEGGWAAVSATGLVDDGPALAASGPWIGLSLGLGLRPR